MDGPCAPHFSTNHPDSHPLCLAHWPPVYQRITVPVTLSSTCAHVHDPRFPPLQGGVLPTCPKSQTRPRRLNRRTQPSRHQCLCPGPSLQLTSAAPGLADHLSFGHLLSLATPSTVSDWASTRQAPRVQHQQDRQDQSLIKDTFTQTQARGAK